MIEDLTSLISSLPSLTELHMKRGETTIDRVHQLVNVLKQKQLVGLTLKGHNVDQEVSHVFEKSQHTLQRLNLGAPLQTSLGDLAAQKISLCLNLVELRLQGCSTITTATLNMILSKCTNICILDLSGCEVTDKTLQILFSNRKRYLHTLELNGCNKLTSKILPGLCKQKQLQVLGMTKDCYCIHPKNLIQLAKELSLLQV
eukprot:TRINITY_DN10975_c0_g1_i1.p1 TRINITY_DN10975_c0_g1~~TRINITY_DN10975_c0_g1_i1.p1  ORF type:complete len:201 (+),score=32.07 TRINITY_DN10975_c0_g1_i1:299-901(+)